jgi:hypothetical protein
MIAFGGAAELSKELWLEFMLKPSNYPKKEENSNKCFEKLKKFLNNYYNKIIFYC